MKRTAAEWEEALFPELLTQFGDRFKGTAVTLKHLGLRRPEEAEALGYVCIRRNPHQRRSSVWVHESNLQEIEQAIEEISAARVARAERVERARAERRRTVDEVLAGYQWMTDEDRATALSRLEQLPIEEINPETLEALLVGRRLATAVDGLQGVRPKGDRLIVSGDLRFSAFGTEVVREVEELTTIALTPEMRRLLMRRDLADFRAAVTAAAAEARAAALSESRIEVYGAIAEAGKRIESTVELLGFETEEETNRVRTTLAEYATSRLKSGGPRSLIRLARGLDEMSHDLVWSRRRELLRAGRSSRHIAWTLAGDRVNPAIVYSLTARIEIGGSEFSARLDRKIPLPRDVRDALFDQPLDVFAGIVEAFVAEVRDEQQAEIDRMMEKVARRVEKVEDLPGFDMKSLTATARSEFAARKVDPTGVASRLSSLVERLTKQARETEAVQALLTRARFSHYSDFFKTARALDRKLVLYVGPTNSGKTYHALNELAAGESGVYLAPLRLLALEGQEELEKRGKPTSFLTGEERDLRPGASFYSSTIEMLNLDRLVDAIVVDEVQLLSDPDRGWAWSAAVIGAPAKRVIMTGSPDAVPLVGELAEYLGEPLELHTLERFTPLVVHEEVDDLDRVEPGTAIVCFSRRDVLGLKQYLEHKHRVSVIYGNLSPQVRREEARRFRSGETSVLVATDAIALGLNLPIKTVIFYTTWKWNGREETRLTSSEIRQIGGRAGRYGKHDSGFVGALSYADLEHVREAFEEPITALPIRAQVRPSLQHVLTMSEVLSSKSLARLLDLFRRRIRFDASHLVAAVPDDMLDLASLSDATGMPLEDRFTFTCAPVDTRNAYMMRNYQLWMNNFALGRVSRIERLQSRYTNTTGEMDPEAFYHAEVLVKVLTVYAWLAYRYPALFPELEECDRQRQTLNRYIERTLRKKGRMRRCASCGNALPPLSQYSICDSCFRSRKRR